MPEPSRYSELTRMLDERVRSQQNSAILGRTDPAARLQYNVTRDLLISADDAMEAEGIPLDVRDRVATRTIWGGDPAFATARQFERGMRDLLAAQPIAPEQVADLKAQIEALGGTAREGQ
jgi:hypothetical protein